MGHVRENIMKFKIVYEDLKQLPVEKIVELPDETKQENPEGFELDYFYHKEMDRLKRKQRKEMLEEIHGMAYDLTDKGYYDLFQLSDSGHWEEIGNLYTKL